MNMHCLSLLQGYIWDASLLTCNSPVLRMSRPMKKKEKVNKSLVSIFINKSIRRIQRIIALLNRNQVYDDMGKLKS